MIATQPICGQMVPWNQPRRFGAEVQVARQRARAGICAGPRISSVMRTPDQKHHHHHGRDLHDAQRLAARFVNALDVAPPEIDGDDHAEDRGETGSGAMRDARRAVISANLVQQAAQILPGADAR